VDDGNGLFYNFNRFYDPLAGRYTQADPIGLNGGWNRFGYVGGMRFRLLIRWDWLQDQFLQILEEAQILEAQQPAPGTTVLLHHSTYQRLTQRKNHGGLRVKTTKAQRCAPNINQPMGLVLPVALEIML
jgi:hypothetical protein